MGQRYIDFSAHGSPWVSAITKAHLYHDGRVVSDLNSDPIYLYQQSSKTHLYIQSTWEPPVIYHSFCTINIEWYPYDVQQCEMKFGSWTYGGTQLDLTHRPTLGKKWTLLIYGEDIPK
ncbi:hypothetical protein DICVIV_07359 [Dictyocaulus viviparus]|uniref:Neurotransmitter-gated ion-channel ligand-binding domain-containing protein n=1 Tax=Dictyocaulus viviparus TaxID=29172 RepID=A0A0D8XW34_DICVI|nr:hypothetical protein DICVIV_07359 [Dictyocaulus viviparus]